MLAKQPFQSRALQLRSWSQQPVCGGHECQVFYNLVAETHDCELVKWTPR
jgi:hypothetical protein